MAPVGAEGVVKKREASGPAPVHSAITLYASLVSPSTTLSHTLPVAGNPLPRKAYVHLVQTSGYNPEKAGGAKVKLTGPDGNAVELAEGDGVYVMGDPGTKLDLENVGDRVAEILLFDC